MQLPNEESLTFIESLYEDYLRDPESVSPEWRQYFRALAEENGRPARPSFVPRSIFNPTAATPSAPDEVARMAILQDKVDQLVRSYRVRGHVIARLDPLGGEPPLHPELDYRYYGLTDQDLDRLFSVQTFRWVPSRFLPLREILAHLRQTYCGHIGVQYMHIDDVDIKNWIQSNLEDPSRRVTLSREEQIRILTRLTDAEIFEQFVHRKFVGAKRFSLEGAESLIPLLDLALEEAGNHGVQEVVIGMAHRGRLNVLANIIGKSVAQIFREFEDTDPHLHFGRGDVKYHLGHSSRWRTESGREIDLVLCFNPSHLGFVGPVVLGRVRARQDRVGDERARERVMALVIHGDAAFIGQGLTQETLNLSELAGYAVGGTAHIVVNNQLGFTTPPQSARSTQYPTDVARMLQVPIFHVNGEHPEAVARVIRLAMDFRQTFHKDVIIDMYCYRRHGHNEGDEPSFTQPLLYRHISQRKSVRESYVENLLKLNKITREEADHIAVQRRQHLEKELERARQRTFTYKVEAPSGGPWSSYRGGDDRDVPEVPTSVPRQELAELLEAWCRVPEGFHLHPKLEKFLEQRRQMARGERPLDWGAGEALALASLAAQGFRVRLSGQDSQRGTFSHRHAVWHDYETGERYYPFQHVARGQAPVDIWDSPLSEAGVLGFDYGYSLDWPDGLVIWEAQFGDFVNVAQVYIDQFLSSGEDKWQQLSGITLFLPHGFEGQGPEHSSARLERFLALCAQDNMQVVNLSTPAQLFHCLRRQVLRPWRKPLVVMSPKSLLRHPDCSSPLEDLAEGHFQRIIPDLEASPDKVKRILLCSGKIYYELRAARAQRQAAEFAIVRLEQYYPLSDEALRRALAPYPKGVPVMWVQEEPENMGALYFLRHRYGERLFGRRPFFHVSRPLSASPATGSAESHRVEQEWLISQAFDLS
jgi:2-oxoglutarate dehydrogenase E1 component